MPHARRPVMTTPTGPMLASQKEAGSSVELSPPGTGTLPWCSGCAAGCGFSGAGAGFDAGACGELRSEFRVGRFPIACGLGVCAEGATDFGGGGACADLASACCDAADE